MLYLLWGILNIVLFVLFIFAGFKITKRIREKWGLLVAVVFVTLLLSFITVSSDNKKRAGEIENKVTVRSDKKINMKSGVANVILEKTLISSNILDLFYERSSESEASASVNAYSYTTGFVSGTKWEPNSISVKFAGSTDKLDYSVSGVVEWRLLWLTVFSQYKTYTGFIEIE